MSAATEGVDRAGGSARDDLPVLPHGGWPSPITARVLTEAAATPGELRVDGDDVWWSESRPADGGRVVLVRRIAGGPPQDVLPDGFSARTRVHEYGGGAWGVLDGTAVFANWSDQRVYRLDRGSDRPVPITPAPPEPHAWRFADLHPVAPGLWGPDGWLVAVRENHDPRVVEEHGEAVNEIVAVPLDGRAADDPSAVRVLARGADFHSSPRVAPDGSALAWTRWNHPHMPWDTTELVVCRVTPAGTDAADADPTAGPTAGPTEVLAGGTDESVVQPEWGADGALWFCSDRTGWWNLYRLPADAVLARAADTGVPDTGAPDRGTTGGSVGPDRAVAVAPVEGEIGGPQWALGGRWYALLPDGTVGCALNRSGTTVPALVDPSMPKKEPRPLPGELTWVDQVQAAPDGSLLLIGAGPAHESAVWRVHRDGTAQLVSTPRDLGLGPEWFAPPQTVRFRSEGGRDAHAVLYLPRNPRVRAPRDARPPLLVFSHGGPTSQTRAMLTLGVQYWTSRGFAVVDVNYGGSTGYGRAYRELLRGAWGVVDVQDCTAAALHLASEGQVDGTRLAIRGGSAGGYTTLATLVFRDEFAAGASHYGVADLGALARDTHKFESRYLGGLVGPWPQAEPTYRQRSPIFHTEGLNCPLAVFQGLEDEVVPPAQAQMMVDAVRAKGLPYVYLAFEGEQHGFRRAENIVRALESELWFYGRVFGFEPADVVPTPPGGGF